MKLLFPKCRTVPLPPLNPTESTRFVPKRFVLLADYKFPWNSYPHNTLPLQEYANTSYSWSRKVPGLSITVLHHNRYVRFQMISSVIRLKIFLELIFPTTRCRYKSTWKVPQDHKCYLTTTRFVQLAYHLTNSIVYSFDTKTPLTYQ